MFFYWVGVLDFSRLERCCFRYLSIVLLELGFERRFEVMIVFDSITAFEVGMKAVGRFEWYLTA